MKLDMGTGRLASIVLLLVLCVYAARTAPVTPLADILASPEQWTGKSVELFVEMVVDSIGADGFLVRQRQSSLWVRGAAGEAERGDFVSIDGIFLPDRTLQLGQMRVAKYRRLKIAISLVGMLAAFLFLIASLSWTGRALEVQADA